LTIPNLDRPLTPFFEHLAESLRRQVPCGTYTTGLAETIDWRTLPEDPENTIAALQARALLLREALADCAAELDRYAHSKSSFGYGALVRARGVLSHTAQPPTH
jgi:hypothetical protein